MKSLILIRHGQSTWNQQNRFTGWKDVGLTAQGIKEAQEAGALLKSKGFEFDQVWTSVLTRAIQTTWHLLDSLEQQWLPVEKDWRLNERHYGGLQGLNKAETAEKYGEDQVKIWRRSYSTLPPLLELSDERHPRHDRRYAHLNPEELPSGESLETTVKRVVPYWETILKPALTQGTRGLVVAHGNSLRALIKVLEKISDEEITELNIPTGTPIQMDFDDDFNVLSRNYLGDPDAIAAAAQAVANQGKSV
ncbi:MAG: 2,3-diphosphoglycerate-dependent phosphoglycerate mutase [Bdellovibrionaceae bacterium]|nr:2,3-diphosphoglycerate-dependent phosphoglycerate mutase [Pseudobdellovibrionaceae bacterium]|tara:strand:- start:1932 stop:2678 length:747 start_codon:yes stop_codon:yes gene_type:complete